MVTCPKCGTPVRSGQIHCTNCGGNIPLRVQEQVKSQQERPVAPPVNQAQMQNVKMNFCYKCGNKIVEGHQFCPCCGTKVEGVLESPSTSHVNNVSYVSTQKSNIDDKTSGKVTKMVNVQKGRYVGKKWFIKLPYKMYETDVEFFDEHMMLTQGTGFAKAGYKIPVQIRYDAIYSVEAKKKYSIPNIVFSVIVAIIAVAMQVWAALLVSLLVLFIGKTAVVTINHSAGVYTIPTEFISEAEELRNRINTARNQSRG